ncbi:hypothetical protein NDU88_005376 [Pleurodeles waltl]|uniref:Uncharacterized protein n=1 Tax=Pleurodeles waltl TaxID=8319 RepID=A0AAV7TA83_PLEWA|nr:hypothetical protein NDU88_005376 [Pleurodeles waltl]
MIPILVIKRIQHKAFIDIFSLLEIQKAGLDLLLQNKKDEGKSVARALLRRHAPRALDSGFLGDGSCCGLIFLHPRTPVRRGRPSQKSRGLDCSLGKQRLAEGSLAGFLAAFTRSGFAFLFR